MTLRVILQIVPFGNEEKIYEIDRLDISNFGTNAVDPEQYDYAWKFKKDKDYNLKRFVPHFRKNGPWYLLYKVLAKTDDI